MNLDDTTDEGECSDEGREEDYEQSVALASSMPPLKKSRPNAIVSPDVAVAFNRT